MSHSNGKLIRRFAALIGLTTDRDLKRGFKKLSDSVKHTEREHMLSRIGLKLSWSEQQQAIKRADDLIGLSRL